MRNPDCSNYFECLQVAAIANSKKMPCLSCDKSNDLARLDVANPLLREMALRCAALLVALYLSEAPEESAAYPAVMLGWKITFHNRKKYYRGYKLIGGKIRYRYLGKSLDGATEKLAAVL